MFFFLHVLWKITQKVDFGGCVGHPLFCVLKTGQPLQINQQEAFGGGKHLNLGLKENWHLAIHSSSHGSAACLNSGETEESGL